MQEGLVNNRGVEMIHEIGMSCTCRVEDVFAGLQGDGEDRRREPFCARCGQDGWLFRDPVLLTGIITGIRHQRNILDVGSAHPGDATFSPRPNDPVCAGDVRRVGAFDKLTATWPEPIDDGHVLRRGAGSKARLDGINTELDTNEDRLWYEPANAIWCEDEFGVVYIEDTDFELGPGKIIKWVGRTPADNVRFVIKYNAYFEWIVYQPPTERRDRGGKNLGELLQLRKRHVALINSSPFATSEDKQSLQAKVTC